MTGKLTSEIQRHGESISRNPTRSTQLGGYKTTVPAPSGVPDRGLQGSPCRAAPAPAQRKEIVRCAERLMKAASRERLDGYMQAHHELDQANHQASHNSSAVKAVVPLVIQWRRFWYAYQQEGDTVEGASAHTELAEGIASGDVSVERLGSTNPMRESYRQLQEQAFASHLVSEESACEHLNAVGR